MRPEPVEGGGGSDGGSRGRREKRRGGEEEQLSPPQVALRCVYLPSLPSEQLPTRVRVETPPNLGPAYSPSVAGRGGWVGGAVVHDGNNSFEITPRLKQNPDVLHQDS